MRRNGRASKRSGAESLGKRRGSVSIEIIYDGLLALDHVTSATITFLRLSPSARFLSFQGASIHLRKLYPEPGKGCGRLTD
jgi:hypothetical protein